ncbi:MAG TPA: DUF899 domain-containing protein [Opitutaceae bacterium]|nr:DUF899 domain-containing protein [Opitutaceae bacterium]
MITTNPIDFPPIVTRDEWLAARKRHLETEKEFTKARDRLNTRRRELPMVRMDKDYVFEGPGGKVRLIDLFEGRQQLIVYHFMWLWENGQPLDEGCRSCSGWADQIARGHFTSLHARGTSLILISRAPFAKIAPFKARMGWTIPWYSSFGNDFNYDFNVTLDESVAPIVYNYRTKEEHEHAGSSYYLGDDQPFDLHGMSCFLRRDDEVFHTYSTYGRGVEAAGGAYNLLDLTALGRQEDWEEPKGRATGLGAPAGSEKIRYPDQYDE